MSERVADYPRPPRLEHVTKHVRVVKNGIVIADTRRAARVLETFHAPVYYLDPRDVRMEHLTEAAGTSFCEWKGYAAYYDVLDARRAAWTYREPYQDFASLAGFIAFYAAHMDECTVDGERVTPQPGGFYGGWITKDLVGPFKGSAGTQGW
jgi:uncharacterized protein (DUF427 family)